MPPAVGAEKLIVNVVPDIEAEVILGWLDTEEDTPTVKLCFEFNSPDIAKERLKNRKVQKEINLNFR